MSASDHINEQLKGALSLVSHTELVPISHLNRMKGNRYRYDPAELIPSIEKEGLQEPGVVEYDQTSRRAVLGEGHHRMRALELMGATHFPVRGMRVGEYEALITTKGIPVRGMEPNAGGHIPRYINPSDFMDWDED